MERLPADIETKREDFRTSENCVLAGEAGVAFSGVRFREHLRGHLDGGGAETGARTGGPHDLGEHGRDARQGPDLRSAQGIKRWDGQGPELRRSLEQPASARGFQGQVGAGGAERPEKAASSEPGPIAKPYADKECDSPVSSIQVARKVWPGLRELRRSLSR
jgi:hypothetical protein